MIAASPADRASYQTIANLATGGMGQVDLAVRRQGSFTRFYAVKRLKKESRSDSRYHKMFMEEARVAGMIRHANVVSVLDVGEDESGPFLVMDFVEGITGAQLIDWAGANQTLLPVQLAARVIRQAASGLSAAHELKNQNGKRLNLVHRDISPQNLLIGYDGIVRVADFGIAKALGRATQTTTGLLKGKAGYMAPEQLRFERAKQSCDLFSLGVVFFECLTSTRLYGGKDSIEIAQRVLKEAPPDIYETREDVHPAIVELLFDLLAKDPLSRPASAQDVVLRLNAVIDELVAEEGAIRVESFLNEHFASLRKEKTEQRTQQLQAFDQGVSSVELNQSSALPTTRIHRPRRTRLLAGLALGTTALAASLTFAMVENRKVEPSPIVKRSAISLEKARLPAATDMREIQVAEGKEVNITENNKGASKATTKPALDVRKKRRKKRRRKSSVAVPSPMTKARRPSSMVVDF